MCSVEHIPCPPPVFKIQVAFLSNVLHILSQEIKKVRLHPKKFCFVTQTQQQYAIRINLKSKVDTFVYINTSRSDCLYLSGVIRIVYVFVITIFSGLSIRLGCTINILTLNRTYVSIEKMPRFCGVTYYITHTDTYTRMKIIPVQNQRFWAR